MDDAVAAAWESMWHDYSATNVETVGMGIDPDKLRARVLRGVEEGWEEKGEEKDKSDEVEEKEKEGEEIEKENEEIKGIAKGKSN